MNRQLIANAFDKVAEAAALFAEGFRNPEDETLQPQAAAAPAPVTKKAAPAAEPEKKARKSTAAKAAPVVEETEDESEDEASDEAEEQDDFADVEDEETAAPAKVSKDELRKSIVAYAKKHGKPKAYALLEKFGSKNVDGLKAADLEKVNTLIQKGLK